jgi:alpha-tubulin suppressor-like RCC1 family protein
VEDALGRILFAAETNAVGSPYASFHFTAHDGDSASAPALLTLDLQIQKPYAIAQPTTPLGATGVTFHGVVTPNNSPTTAWFEWGETSGYGQNSVPVEVGDTANPVRLSIPVTTLAASANYHGRLVASNQIGINFGTDFIFTTGEKVTVQASAGNALLKFPAGLSNTVALALGNNHAVALNANGAVTAWGAGSSQTNVPVTASNVIALSAQAYHTLALRADGTVVGWGVDLNGQATPPAGLNNVIAIAAGLSNSFALKSDGAVTGWGKNVKGELTIPPGLNHVVAIACGFQHALALRHDGTVVSWGDNYLGQTNAPSDLTNIVAIAAGGYQSIALRADGTTVAWGANTWPTLTNIVAVADQLALRADNRAVVIGTANTLVSLTNVAAAAGTSSRGVFLANVPPTATSKTVTVPANFDSVITLSGTDTNADLLSFEISSLPTNGTLYQFTTNGRGAQITLAGTAVADLSGRILYAPITNQFSPPLDGFTFVANDGDVDSAAAQIQINLTATRPIPHTLPTTPVAANSIQLHGLLLAGNLPTSTWFEWGTNAALGFSTPIQDAPFRPEVVPATATLTNLSPLIVYRFRLVASNALGLAYGAEQRFTTGQRLTGWGLNHAGQSAIPLGLSNSVSVQAGGSHSLALRPDGTLVAWGENYTGGPTQPVLSNLIAVASGWYHGLALSSNGTVITWGQNFQIPQSPVPAGLSNVVAIAAGNVHSLALRADGRVVVWGSNENGQTNLPNNLSNVVAIAGGGRHSLALRAGGHVSAWGHNGNGQCNVPTTLSNVIMIAAGDSHSLALRSNGTVVGWGLSSSGQLNPTANPTNLIAIAAGASHSVGLRSDGTLLIWGDNTYGQRNAPVGLSNVVSITAGLRHNLAIGNVPPLVLPRTFSGAANSDLLVTLSGSDTNSDALDFRLNTLPGAGKLYQYVAGQRGTALTNQATVADPQRRLFFAPPANAYGSPLTNFTYRANDGQADSATATVTLHIAAPTKPLITQFQRTANGITSLTFTGHSNTTYCVWASSNLVTWEYRGLPTQPTNGIFQFLDVDGTAYPQRFYRLSTGCETPLPNLNAGSSLTSSGFDLRFAGGPYWTYRVWSSTNLVNWEPLGTAEEFQPGQFRYLDADSTNRPQRFYKAGSP